MQPGFELLGPCCNNRSTSNIPLMRTDLSLTWETERAPARAYHHPFLPYSFGDYKEENIKPSLQKVQSLFGFGTARGEKRACLPFPCGHAEDI